MDRALTIARRLKKRKGYADGGSPDADVAYDPMSGAQITPTVSETAAPSEPQSKISRTISRLTGTQFGEPRYQTWPEKMTRSGVSLAGDVLSGEQPVLPPGLRREDYTDKPVPSGWEAAAQPNDPMMERAQDMAGLAGGQTLLTGAREAAPAAGRALVAAADSQATGAPLAALEHAPKFYSGLERAVTDAPIKSATGEQWLGTLANRGVKKEELEHTGTQAFLEQNRDVPLTKEQVAAHVGENKLELGEVHKGGLDDPLAEAILGIMSGRLIDNLKTPADIAQAKQFNSNFRETVKGYSDEDILSAAAKAQAGKDLGETKYHSYQLPGGENYREKLLMLPVKKPSNPDGLYAKHEAAMDAVDSYLEANPRSYPENDPVLARLVGERDAINSQIAETPVYKSSHWDEPNVLVHRRTNEREVNGKPSLHVEEIQSDWHQQGRQKGYRPEQEKRLAGLVERRDALQQEAGGLSPSDARYKEIYADLPKLQTEINEIGSGGVGVPDAPFKKNWHELALKDAIREAAEKGLNRISWTPGEAQAARYDLSQHIKEIEYVKNGDGTYRLGIADKEGEPIRSVAGGIDVNRMTLPQIEQTVGKEIAQKIESGEGKKYRGHDGHTLEGIDLKVGGGGMKGFYDKMIPDAMNKIGKPHGVKVENGETRIHPSYWADGPNEPVHRPEQHAPVHYMDIPPSLKEQALKKGFSLFEDSAAAGAPIAATEYRKEKPKHKKSAISMPERNRGGQVNPALDVARKIKRAKGGAVHVGPIVGDTGGRADKVAMDVPANSYVVPADVVSGLGEGNSAAGMKAIASMFPTKRARGGGIPIMAAHGEVVISPQQLEARFGPDLNHAHAIMDEWVKHERAQLIETLKNLPGPAQD